MRIILLALVAFSLVACGQGSESDEGSGGAFTAPNRDAAMERTSASGVLFEVELVGGPAAGRYQAEDKVIACNAIVNDPNAQLNVNASSREMGLSYAQISIYGFTPDDGASDAFVFVAHTDTYELRIDTHPDSWVGNSGSGSVSWQVNGSEEIVIQVEGAVDDGVEVKATITCTAPRWVGLG